MNMREPGRRPHALVVAYHFPPDARVGTMRTLRVVRQLVASAYDVTILTADARTYREGTPIDESLLQAIPPGASVVRAGTFRGFEMLKTAIKGRRASAFDPTLASAGEVVKVPASRRRSRMLQLGDFIDAVLAIPDQESGWLVPAVARGLSASARRRPDIIYSSAPAWTGQLVAYTLASLLRRPWVADFRDPWGRAPWRGDRLAFAMRAARFLERLVVRRADRVLFVSRGNYEEYSAHYGPAFASRFRVVPNGCDVAEFAGLKRRTSPSDPFVLLHAGSLYAGRTPVPLFGAIGRGIREGLIDRTRFRLRFVGAFSLGAHEIKRLLRTMDLEDVVDFLPRVPREQSLQAMMDASALLLLQPNHTVAVPAKLYEYLAAGRPILAIATGETATLVEQSGVGVCEEANDEGAILRALLRVTRMAQESESRPAPELYDGARRAAEMVSVISELVPPARGGDAGDSDAIPLSPWSRI